MQQDPASNEAKTILLLRHSVCGMPLTQAHTSATRFLCATRINRLLTYAHESELLVFFCSPKELSKICNDNKHWTAKLVSFFLLPDAHNFTLYMQFFNFCSYLGFLWASAAEQWQSCPFTSFETTAALCSSLPVQNHVNSRIYFTTYHALLSIA